MTRLQAREVAKAAIRGGRLTEDEKALVRWLQNNGESTHLEVARGVGYSALLRIPDLIDAGYVVKETNPTNGAVYLRAACGCPV